MLAIKKATGPDALPVCLWQENPHRLVSLLAVLRYNAHHFVGISSTLGQLAALIRSGRGVNSFSAKALGSQCGLLLRYCEEIGLPLTAAHLNRFVKKLDSPSDLPVSEIETMLNETQVRLWDELESRVFLHVAADKVAYFESSQFPQVVLDRFPDAAFDADEAGKCLALSRPTACVFHLMRVTEYGLLAIGKKLGIKDERPNWEPVICKIDAELKADYKVRQYKGMAEFLAHVSAHLNAVKVAWRNRAMHVDRKHTMDEAKEIYAATIGLMRYTAENLPKDTGLLGKISGMIKS